MNSWTLNRNFRNSVDSHIDDTKSMHTSTFRRGSEKLRYDLIASDDEILQASSNGIKRTKSFWKFGGGRNSGDDILAGMSLWQHRDLVAAPNLEELRDEVYRKTSSEMDRERDEMEEKANEGTVSPLNQSNSNSSNSYEKRERKDSVTSAEMFEEDENIYGMTPATNALVNEARHNMAPMMHANFQPKSRMKIMKTIEIDIENATDNEHTLKRGQIDYADKRSSRQYREAEMNKKLALAMSSSQNSSRSSNTLKKQNSHEMKNHSTPQNSTKSAQNRNHKRNTAEEDSDEDDNGTLKMSDVNNFFDEIPSEIGMGSSSNVAHMGSSSGLIMKTVKRKDILKQYYTSEDDSDEMELKSTSSDPYDCIVINDHLVRKDEREKLRRQMHANSYHEQQLEFETFRAQDSSANAKKKTENRSAVNNVNVSKNKREREREQMDMQHQQQQQQQHHGMSMHTPTATILPRTRLSKPNTNSNNNNSSSNNKSSATLERNMHKNSRESANLSYNSDKESRHMGKTYGPWYDFWDQQDQQSIVGSKIK